MSKKEQKLPKAFKAKWLKALRSGTFKQGQGRLHEKIEGEDTYCCLGVACVISGVTTRVLGKRGSIPNSVAFKAIPDILKGILKPTNVVACKLACMNDGTSDYNVYPSGKKKGFKGIAIWIEKNL